MLVISLMLFLIGASVLLFSFGYIKYIDFRVKSSWMKIPITTQTVEYKHAPADRGGLYYYPSVSFSYLIDGISYSSDNLGSPPRYYRNKSDHMCINFFEKKMYSSHAYVNPKDVSQAVYSLVSPSNQLKLEPISLMISGVLVLTMTLCLWYYTTKFPLTIFA